MDVDQVVYTGNSLEIKLSSTFMSDKIVISPELTLAGLVGVRIKFEYADINNICYINRKFVKIRKLHKYDKMSYEITVIDNLQKITVNLCPINDSDYWYYVQKTTNTTNAHISFKLDIILPNSSPSLAALYEDKDSTDFELKGNGGSVHMHKMVLSTFSPVFRTMLTGQWKEASEGSVDIKDVTQETLEHLKDFLYLYKLPEEILPLLELADRYMILDLKQYCSIKALLGMSKENAYELLKLAHRFKLKTMFLGIVCQNNGLYNINDMALQMEPDWI